MAFDIDSAVSVDDTIEPVKSSKFNPSTAVSTEESPVSVSVSETDDQQPKQPLFGWGARGFQQTSPGVKKDLKDTAEGAAQLVSGLGASTVGDAAGLGAIVGNILGATNVDPSDLRDWLKDKYTYRAENPDNIISGATRAAGEFIDKAGQGTEGVASNFTSDPLILNTAHQVPNIMLAALGAKSPEVATNTRQVVSKAIDDATITKALKQSGRDAATKNAEILNLPALTEGQIAARGQLQAGLDSADKLKASAKASRLSEKIRKQEASTANKPGGEDLADHYVVQQNALADKIKQFDKDLYDKSVRKDSSERQTVNPVELRQTIEKMSQEMSPEWSQKANSLLDYATDTQKVEISNGTWLDKIITPANVALTTAAAVLNHSLPIEQIAEIVGSSKIAGAVIDKIAPKANPSNWMTIYKANKALKHR